MKITKKMGQFISSERTLKVLVVILTLTALSYIEYIEFNRTTELVTGYMVELIQEDNSFLAQSQ